MDARRVTPDQAKHRLTSDPGTTVLTTCAGFDAVIVPHNVGMAALVRLEEKTGPVPSFAEAHETVTFLVQSDSAHALQGLGGIRVKTGSGAQIALPPSRGIRWDTPPWKSNTREHQELRTAADLKASLHTALRLYGSDLH
ncbi:hypothetical protein ABZ769_34005 [Streptomyces olivoreticuli]